MSSRTSFIDVQTTIEGSIDKRCGSIYGPTGGKELFIFVDDVNMPKVDKYGTQKPIALLLTLLDHGFIYDRKKDVGVKKVIHNSHFIAAMGPSGGGRNSVDPRFIARFCCFNFKNPSERALESIFNNIVSTRMVSFSDGIQETIGSLATSTIGPARLGGGAAGGALARARAPGAGHGAVSGGRDGT